MCMCKWIRFTYPSSTSLYWVRTFLEFNQAWSRKDVITSPKLENKEVSLQKPKLEGRKKGVYGCCHISGQKKKNHQNRDSEASTLRRWSVKSEVLIPKQKFKLFKCAVGEGDIFGFFFYWENFNESPWKLKSYAQQDLKWHGGINECCIHVGKTHNLERPVFNWEAESSLARKGP